MSKIDKIYQKKLNNAELPVPDDMWAKISTELPTKSSKGSNLFWLFGLFGMCGLVVTAITTLPSYNSFDSKIHVDFKDKTIAFNDSNSSINSKDFIAVEETIKNASLEKLAADELTSAKPITKKFQNDNLKNIQSNRSFINKNAARLLAQNESIRLPIKSSSKKYSNQNFSNLLIEDDRNAILSPGNRVSQIVELDALGSIFRNNINYQRETKRDDLACEVFKVKTRDKYVSFSHSSNYVDRSLNIYSNDSNELLETRINTEKYSYSFSDELLIGARFTDRLFAEFGLKYDQINEQFNYKDYSNLYNTTVITIDTIVTNNGVNIVTDTVNMVSGDVIETSVKNKQRRVSVPIYIGYEFPINRRLSVASKIGASINILSSFSGSIFDREMNIVDIDTKQKSQSPIYKNIVHNIQASLIAKYKLDQAFTVFAGISGYKNLGSVSSVEYPIHQKYSAIGMTLGGSFNF